MMTLDLARTMHGACPRCPQPTWHNGAPCPLWARARERDHAVDCAVCGRRKSVITNELRCDRCWSDLDARLAAASAGASGDRASARPVPNPAGEVSVPRAPSPVSLCPGGASPRTASTTGATR